MKRRVKRAVAAMLASSAVWAASAAGQEIRPAEALAEAQALLEQGLFKRALELFRRVERAHPREDRARFGIAVIYMELGRHGEALSMMQDLRTRHPDSPELMNNTAWIRLKAADPALRDVAAARRDAQDALFAMPDNPEIWNTLAEARYQAGEPARALRLAEIALGLAREGRVPQLEVYEKLVERCRAAAGGAGGGTAE